MGIKEREKSTTQDNSFTLGISSTFTCDPINKPLHFWGEKFGQQINIHHSPFNQVPQELLNRDSSLNDPQNDARILFIRFEDWIGKLLGVEDSEIRPFMLDTIHSLCGYTEAAASFRKSPLFLNITHNSINSVIKLKLQRELEELLQDNLYHLPNIFVNTSTELQQKYPVANYYDAHKDRLGRIPFTDTYFSALATSVFRNVLGSKRKPYKVIVLDCDNTLWGGVSGEVGAQGISLSEPYLNLQLFMLNQMKAGKILCLCSKNVPEDVDRVFAERDDMALKKENIVSSKINWNPKSQNIKELARELNLGLDSFIFIDDNSVECAEVRCNCPDVLTLNLPENPQEILKFLEHTWAFDIYNSTSEDQSRTRLYKENIKRSNFEKGSSSLSEFIAGLNLEIDIRDAKSDEISRVSQLSYRTNQFNFTTIRRSEEEINDLIQNNGFSCKICRVNDRFGDYGLVGVMLYKISDKQIILDSFMLSCRVLGRGVEYKMLQSIGKVAVANNINMVQINFTETEKNKPAQNFLQAIIDGQSKHIRTNESGFLIPAPALSNLNYDPDTDRNQKDSKNEEKTTGKPSSDLPNNLIIEHIAKNLNSASKITKQLDGGINGPNNIPKPKSVNKSTLQQITNIWETVLGKSGIGPNQHFFDIGGSSLKAVEVLSELNKRFGRNLTIVSLFEHSTINDLVHLIDGNQTERMEFEKIMRRAQSRKNSFRRK